MNLDFLNEEKMIKKYLQKTEEDEKKQNRKINILDSKEKGNCIFDTNYLPFFTFTDEKEGFVAKHTLSKFVVELAKACEIDLEENTYITEKDFAFTARGSMVKLKLIREQLISIEKVIIDMYQNNIVPKNKVQIEDILQNFEHHFHN